MGRGESQAASCRLPAKLGQQTISALPHLNARLQASGRKSFPIPCYPGRLLLPEENGASIPAALLIAEDRHCRQCLQIQALPALRQEKIDMRVAIR
jgi:hypothetical protein